MMPPTNTIDMRREPLGSTSNFRRVQTGELLKYPRQVSRDSLRYSEIARSFSVEIRILELLQGHPRIVRYFGQGVGEGDERGIRLAEANQGDLQQYLDEHWEEIPENVRRSWCLQVVESVAYIHSRGVIHSDLRPENFLVHAKETGTLELWLCDFGGSTCKNLELDGRSLPDSGFSDPNSPWESTPQTDIFSVGSILYTILTGHWPYRGRGPFSSLDEKYNYERKADDLFRKRQFPEVDKLFAGDVIMKCWEHAYATAEHLLKDILRHAQDA
ncbi:hypothetical protein PCL_07429 [Purpureocillium lilacinum]|uniref:EKC/KEOPS complex subunit BUD32 n=1 Tax=Purpureocillium lilacinum TaxID=33203 RepID=A0A2U3DS89_PURLI|nr:hypothetical protein PCL_07429 [Purpureocillium lilacinum]